MSGCDTWGCGLGVIIGVIIRDNYWGAGFTVDRIILKVSSNLDVSVIIS